MERVAKGSLVLVPKLARELPRNYDGYVFISDIDKTYLATQIDSLSGLLRAAFEAPERKQNVPGFSILLRAVRRGGGPEGRKNPLFFVSASPPQMETKILAKMEIDGVENDGIIFKNQMVHVRRANFKKLKEQIAYKLSALLSLWFELPTASKLVLFGDDSESDAVIFSLFAEILAGHLRGKELFELLIHLRVFREEALKVSWFSRRLGAPVFPVKAAFINLDTGSVASYYSRLANFIYATDNSLQAALAMYEQNLIREQAVRSIGRDLILHHDYEPHKLLRSLEEGARRGTYGLETLDKLWPLLFEAQVLPPPQKRPESEGAVTRLNLQRWERSWTRSSLQEMKKRFSEEGRY